MFQIIDTWKPTGNPVQVKRAADGFYNDAEAANTKETALLSKQASQPLMPNTLGNEYYQLC